LNDSKDFEREYESEKISKEELENQRNKLLKLYYRKD
jgi:hypothetical protein